MNRQRLVHSVTQRPYCASYALTACTNVRSDQFGFEYKIFFKDKKEHHSYLCIIQGYVNEILTVHQIAVESLFFVAPRKK